jgi:hypothetical protein
VAFLEEVKKYKMDSDTKADQRPKFEPGEARWVAADLAGYYLCWKTTNMFLSQTTADYAARKQRRNKLLDENSTQTARCGLTVTSPLH